MKKITIFTALLVFFSIGFFSCKKNSNNALVANYQVSDTLGGTAINLALNITDNAHYNLGATVAGAFQGGDTGTYSTSGGSIIFTSTGVTSSCRNNPGTYAYSLTGNDLILVATNDSCYFGPQLRSTYLSNIWVK